MRSREPARRIAARAVPDVDPLALENEVPGISPDAGHGVRDQHHLIDWFAPLRELERRRMDMMTVDDDSAPDAVVFESGADDARLPRCELRHSIEQMRHPG